MSTATTLVRKAAVKPDQIVDTIRLDHAARKAQHGHFTAEGGLAFDLALARATLLEDGDALRLEDGRLVVVRAVEEALIEVRAENPARLIRLAWQLGGSHVPAEVGADVLYVPVRAADLVRGSGCTGSPVTRAFKPEKEAHDHSTCGHDHSHDHHHHAHEHHHHEGQGHSQVHSHSHSVSHSHASSHAEAHVHHHTHGSHGHDH